MRYPDMMGKSRMSRDKSRADKVMAGAGYAKGGSAKADCPPAMKKGGAKPDASAEGGKGKSRADRYARGGAVKDAKTKISININSTPPKDDDAAKKAAIGALLAGGPKPPAPPPVPPMAVGAPLAGGPAPGMKTGGKVKAPKMDGGAGGGLGRLEKSKDQKRINSVAPKVGNRAKGQG